MNRTEVGALVVFALLTLAFANVGRAATVRLALIVGNDEGASADTRLRYAERDAAEMERVLREHAGVEHAEVLAGQRAADLRQALGRLAETVRGADDDVMVFFYYSGHADDAALRMADSRFPFSELRATLGSLGARVCVAIVDACQSGSAIRIKGGRQVPVVDVHFDFDEARTYEGRVFITSSAAGERAQESDDIEASVFTHYLLAGLRGAADDSGDRLVSLEEVYRYAYARTLHRTAGTLQGPQHPSVDVNITGRGQLILTRLNAAASYLVFPPSGPGAWIVRDLGRARVVAELPAEAGRRTRLAVAPGDYEVQWRTDGHLRRGTVTLAAAAEHEVERARLTAVSGPVAAATPKGGQAASTVPVATVAAASADAREALVGGPFDRPNRVGMAYELGSAYLDDARLRHGVALSYMRSLGSLALGTVASYAHARYYRQDDVAVELHEATAWARLDFRLWRRRAVELGVGLDVGAAWVWQRGRWPGGGNRTLAGPQFRYRLRAGVALQLIDPLILELWGHGGQVVLDRNGSVQAPFCGGFGAGVAVAF